MYLVSVYFDEETQKIINRHIKTVAERTGNMYMLECNVPPHITISAFETNQEECVMERLEACMEQVKRGMIQWASVGAFFPHVIYMTPVLNEYLHQLSVTIFDTIKDVEGVSIRNCYKPLQWLPHTTIAKKLSKEQMQTAFATLQESFGMFKGEVVQIGLAKTNPYEDIVRWDL